MVSAVLYLDVIIRRFLLGVETCSSIDCVLVRLSSTIMELEDLCREFGWDRREVVREFLQDKRVMRITAGLYRQVNSVLYRVEADPRFKVLKPYEDLLYESIIVSMDKSIKPIRVFKNESRPPLWRIEYGGKHPDTDVEYSFSSPRDLKGVNTAGAGTHNWLAPVHTRTNKVETRRKRGTKRSWWKIAIAIILLLLGGVILSHLAPFLGTLHVDSERSNSSYYPLSREWRITTNSAFIGGTTPATENPRYGQVFQTYTSIPCNRLVLDNLEIYANASYIWFKIKSIIEPLIILRAGKREYSIVAHRPSFPNSKAADLVVADDKEFTLYISFHRLAELIDGTNICEFFVYPVDIMVRARINIYNREITFIDTGHVNISIKKEGIQNSVYSVVLQSLNNHTFNMLRRAIWGGHVPPDKASILWSLVSYAEHHFSYDYMKANMTNLYIYYPETMLREKKGICIDYAVFYAVSLIAAGFSRSYIFTVGTSLGGHAFAVARINGTYYVLDQQLPIPEISDYYQYSNMILGAKIDPHTYVYEVEITGAGPRILFHEINIARIPDSYPEDRIDGRLVFQVLIDLAKQLHVHTSLVVEAGSNIIEYDNLTVLHLYTPEMTKQWAQYLASIIARDLAREARHLDYVAIRQNGPVSIIVYYK